MEIKNESELINWVYDMHLQNLSGREDFTQAFKQGIEATIEELRELKLLNLPDVVKVEQSETFATCICCGITYNIEDSGSSRLCDICNTTG